jgi:hypothetical protein
MAKNNTKWKKGKQRTPSPQGEGWGEAMQTGYGFYNINRTIVKDNIRFTSLFQQSSGMYHPSLPGLRHSDF